MILLFVSYKLDASIEGDQSQFQSRGLAVELKQSISEIVEALKVPMFHRVILFMLLNALLIPSFGTFGYYFMLDIVLLSKTTIAMLGVLGYICLLAGSSLYQYGFHKLEFRTLSVYGIMLSLVFAPMSLLFVLRLNVYYGMPDMFVIIFSEVVSDILG